MLAKRKRILSWLLAVAMTLSMLPAAALAEGEEAPEAGTCTCTTQCTEGTVNAECPVCGAEGADLEACEGAAEEDEPEDPSTDAVCKIGDKSYASLDEAIGEAEDGATIELLTDAETEGFNLNKDLTVAAAEGVKKPTITFTRYGIALWGVSLTLENCNVEMEGIGSTPYTAEWNWMTICASKNASLSLDNVTMTMDGTDAGNAHAIYFCSNNKLNLKNGTTLIIQNYQQDALEWDGGNGGYNVNIEDSTFVSDHNRSGFTGTFYATITDSIVDVINSTGNGSNGSNFIIENSEVNFKDNGAHGLSAGTLTIDHSEVTATGNGGNGIHTSSTLTIQNSAVVTIKNNDCSISSKWTIPGALHVGNGDSRIDAASEVTIENNSGSGILLKAGTLTVEAGAKLTIKNNTAEKLGLGGGINNRGTLILPPDIELYNNHASTAGDDIYNTENATITFGKVGDGWMLDGDKDKLDCDGESHAIDGWYDDSEDNRWEAHKVPYHFEEFTGFTTDGTATLSGVYALKAAHARMVTLKFDPNAGSDPTSNIPDDQTGIKYNTAGTEPTGEAPYRYDNSDDWNWEFTGWYTTPECTDKFDFDTLLTEDTTVYAGWEKKEVVKVGSLTISKTVEEGAPTDNDKEFTFALTIPNVTVTAEQVDTTGGGTFDANADGTYTVKLSSGESISINELPNDARYTVTEVLAKGDYYKTVIDSYSEDLRTQTVEEERRTVSAIASGAIKAGWARYVHFTNTPVEPDAPGLGVNKELTEVNGRTYRGGRVDTGDTLTYTITVTNTGNTMLDRVNVTDTLPSGLRLSSGESSWSISGLAAGESRTFTLDAAVRASAEGDLLTNRVTAAAGEITATASDSVRVDEDDDDTPTPPPPPPG